MQAIAQSIRAIYPVSDASWARFCALTHELQLPRKHPLIRAGLACGHVYFIEQGLCRSYCMIEDDELTSWFSCEGDFTFAMNELYYGKPGFESVELLEDSLIYALKITDLNNQHESNLDWCNWSRICHQQHLLRVQVARIDRLTLTAEQRYQKLLREWPQLHQRVNLGYLASYLGMTPQSLSRLRANRTFSS